LTIIIIIIIIIVQRVQYEQTNNTEESYLGIKLPVPVPLPGQLIDRFQHSFTNENYTYKCQIYPFIYRV